MSDCLKARNKKSYDILLLAVKFNQLEILKFCVQILKLKITHSNQTDKGETLLHLGVINLSKEILNYLSKFDLEFHSMMNIKNSKLKIPKDLIPQDSEFRSFFESLNFMLKNRHLEKSK